MKPKNKLENSELKNSIGKSSLLRIDWKDWKKETPKDCDSIFVIVKLDKGYYPVSATYFDEKLGKAYYRRVRFDGAPLPDIFLGSNEEKRLIAWGKLEKVKFLTKECPICKELQCQC